MVKVGTLVTYPNYYRSQKALIASAISGIEVDVTYVDDDSPPPGTRVPSLCLSTTEAPLFDATAIAFLLSDDSLRGRSVAEATDVLQWVNFAENELLPPICSWVFPLLGIVKPGPDVKWAAKAKDDTLALLKFLDKHLLYRTYVTGDRLTLADIAIFCNLTFIYKHVLSPARRNPFTCLNRWFRTLHNHPQVRCEVGDFEWCTNELLPLAAGTSNAKKKEKSQPLKQESGDQSKEQPSSQGAMFGKEELLLKFQSLEMEWVAIQHPEVFTVETMMPHLKHLPVPGSVGKNLFLKDKKKKLYLLTVHHDRPVRLDAIAKTLGASGGLRLADESILETTLGVKQGCVTPYALINDSNNLVTLLLDSVFVPADINDNSYAYFHPMDNAATTGLSKLDFQRFLDFIHHPPTILDMTDLQ